MQEMRIITHEAIQEDKIPVCGYARVTTDKDEQAESYYLQDSYWTRKLTAEPKYHFVGMFGDEAVSGATQRKRKGFLEMIKLCKMGKVKVIFTKSVARFGRNTQETLTTVKELREIGVTVVFENDGIDTSQLTDELMLRLKAIIAEEELRTMSRNVAWSARKRASEGTVELARVFGYDIIRKDKKVHLKVNHQEAEIVRKIFELYLGGLGFIAIANYLQNINARTKCGGTWGKTQVAEILCQEKYTGDALLQKTFTEYGVKKKNEGQLPKVEIQYNHEPIISRETFAKAQAEKVKRASGIKFCLEPIMTEFTSKVECGHCGKHYNRRKNSKIINFGKECWSCKTANNRGVDACPSNQINEGLLKEITIDAFNEYLATPNKTTNTENIQLEIQKLVEQENRIRQLFQDGKITYSTFMDAQKELKDRYRKCDDRIAQEQGFELYTKEGRTAKEYTPDIVETHIEKIIIKGYKITFIFKNQQKIKKEFMYAHRRYCKAY